MTKPPNRDKEKNVIEQLNQIHNQLVSEGKDEAADLIAQAIVALGGSQAADSSGGTGGGDPDGGKH